MDIQMSVSFMDIQMSVNWPLDSHVIPKVVLIAQITTVGKVGHICLPFEVFEGQRGRGEKAEHKVCRALCSNCIILTAYFWVHVQHAKYFIFISPPPGAISIHSEER